MLVVKRAGEKLKLLPGTGNSQHRGHGALASVRSDSNTLIRAGGPAAHEARVDSRIARFCLRKGRQFLARTSPEVRESRSKYLPVTTKQP